MPVLLGIRNKKFNKSKILLYIFSGLPATGKSELSKNLAYKLGAVYLRIDSIEQSIKDNGLAVAEGQGYEVAYKIALDNLKLGLSVVADSVNPLPITRAAWRDVANKAGCEYCDIEIICSDKEEHKRRVESRISDVEGVQLPSWKDVVNRDYRKWINERIIIDTANKSIAESQKEIEQAIETNV
ncbi:MAG: AAA family ATPase [Balneolaceae bacterium]